MSTRTNLHDGTTAEKYLEAYVKRMIAGKLDTATDAAPISVVKGMPSEPGQLWAVDDPATGHAVDARVAAGDATRIEYFNALHRTARGHHGSDKFLGWHRSYLVEYEKALGMAIPYWNWSVNPTLPDVLRLSNLRDATKYDTSVFSAAEITAAVDYFTKLNRTAEGLGSRAAPAANFVAQLVSHIDDKISDMSKDSRRVAVGPLGAADQAAFDLMRNDFPKTPYDWYQNFAGILEGHIEPVLNGNSPFVAVTVSQRVMFQAHDAVHVAIGGQMGATMTAAFDPAFWLHHAYIDKIWHDLVETLRQNRVAPTLAQFETGQPAGALPAPYDSDTYASVRSVSALGYDYDDAFLRQVTLLIRSTLRTFF